ncbi:MAG: hypothetical protein RJQ14_23395, partial [Marinoscillum sp.]
EIDDDDNIGLGSKVALTTEGRIIPFAPGYKLTSNISYEFDNKQFTFIDRFRSVDFDRDWSYDVFSDSLLSREDHIFVVESGAVKDSRNLFESSYTYRNRAGVIDGHQATLKVNQHVGPLQFSSTNYYLDNQPAAYRARWIRSSQQIQLVDWVVKPGYRIALDQHQIKSPNTDSIRSTLMNYVLHNPFIETGDSSRLAIRMDYISRVDKIPQLGKLVDYTYAEEFKLGIQTKRYKNHEVNTQVNYRIVDEQLVDADKEKNLLGRLSWVGYFANRHIVSNLTYTTSNARELKREFVFLQVATGEGTHTWRDENSDGEQDLNEFYEAVNQDERNYIKLFTPTDEYINAYQTTYLHSLDMRMPDQWKNESLILSSLSRLSLNSNLKFNYKTTSGSLSDRLNPFEIDLNDPDVITTRNLIRNTLFYNRNAPGIGFDLSRSIQHTKSLLSGGYEIRQKEGWIGNFRVGFSRAFTLRGGLEQGNTINSSDFLETRNFDLMRSDFNSEFVWQPSNSFRFIGGVERRLKSAIQLGEERTSEIMDYSVDVTWVRSAKGNLNVTFSWIDIGFQGEQNTYLGYELLEALQPGTNQKWNINWQQTLGKGLQLSLQYYGRKSEMNNPIHTGSVSVTAYF